MEFLVLVFYTVVIFYIGMRHERTRWEQLVEPLPFTPHRPRLLDSPYRSSLEAITTARAGTGLSNKEIA